MRLSTSSCLLQLSPCGYSDMSLSIHRSSILFSSISLSLMGRTLPSLFVSSTCSICLMIFCVPLHRPFLKWLCNVLESFEFSIFCLCLVILSFSDWPVWPTYCRSHLLHCITYTTYLVFQSARHGWCMPCLRLLIWLDWYISIYCAGGRCDPCTSL